MNPQSHENKILNPMLNGSRVYQANMVIVRLPVSKMPSL